MRPKPLKLSIKKSSLKDCCKQVFSPRYSFLSSILGNSYQSYSYALILIFFSPSLMADLYSFKAEYAIKTLGMTQAMATNELKLEQNSYHYQSSISPNGWFASFSQGRREENSQGLIIDKLIRPDLYQYQLSRDGVLRRQVEISFLHEQNKIVNFHKHLNNQWKMASAPEVQDRLSYQLALMLKLQENQHLNRQHHFYFTVADGGRLKNYSFEILGEQDLETPLGLLHTLKLKHRNHYNPDDRMTIWCAADLGYLPVKIIQEKLHAPDFVSEIRSYKRYSPELSNNSPEPEKNSPETSSKQDNRNQ